MNERLYVIQSGEFFKVGVSRYITKRLEDMRLLNPHTPTLVFYRTPRTGFSRSVERRVHELLVEHSIGREWFACDIQKIRRAVKVAMQEADTDHWRRLRGEPELYRTKGQKRVIGVDYGQASEESIINQILN